MALCKASKELSSLAPQATMKGVHVPSSVPQLTTKQVLTMSFIEGQPITRLRVSHASSLLTSVPCPAHQ